MNLKKLSLGLALAGLGVFTLIPKAEAFQFRYLNQAPNPEGGFDFNFELKADSSYYYDNYIYSGETLTVRGFQGISNAALTAPQTNQSGMICLMRSNHARIHPSQVTIFASIQKCPPIFVSQGGKIKT
jgi:hypothetical protein